MRIPTTLVLVVASLGAVTPARGDELDAAKVKATIDKGLAWLESKHEKSGLYAETPGNVPQETGYPIGRTAIATFTLLKCGVKPDDPRIQASFDAMYAEAFQKTYEVAMLVLAIEARYAPTDEELDKEEEKRGYGGVARRRFAKLARPEDQKKLQECVDWLVTNRHQAVWRYPGAAQDGALEDHSCAQYAMLALKSASRLGARVPLEVFEKVADHFVAQQDPDGPEVQWFPVPAADGPIRDMLPPAKREKELEKERKQREKEAKRGGGETAERGPGGGKSGERARMRARGWSYLPRGGTGVQSGDHGNESTGSMTASGVAALCIAKSELENSKGAWAARADKVEQAIRDGCAWLSRYFIVQANPTSNQGMTINWKYYYLYGCERAGVLAGTYRFGEHDWWDEGAAHLLSAQTSEGCWPEEFGLSKLCTTCFALLFLKRATIPLVPLPPKRVMTGGGR